MNFYPQLKTQKQILLPYFFSVLYLFDEYYFDYSLLMILIFLKVPEYHYNLCFYLNLLKIKQIYLNNFFSTPAFFNIISI